MKKHVKLLNFMLLQEKQHRTQPFWFYDVDYCKGKVKTDEDGKYILHYGDDLPKLKKYIKENDDYKIQEMLNFVFKNKFTSNSFRESNSPYADLLLTKDGRRYLENLTKSRWENWKFWLNFVIASLGIILGICGYFFPNETKIQTIVKTELQNTTKVTIESK